MLREKIIQQRCKDIERVSCSVKHTQDSLLRQMAFEDSIQNENIFIVFAGFKGMYTCHKTPNLSEGPILSTVFVVGTWHRALYVYMSFNYHPERIV